MIGGKGNGMFPDKCLTGLSEGVLEALVLRCEPGRYAAGSGGDSPMFYPRI